VAQPLVGIRELKSRLGHYLRLTRKGVSVVITDRGVPIGRIVPMGQDLAHRGKRMSRTRERAAIMAAVLAEDERTKRKARRRP
jgi:prevent-host-death family protein